MAKILLAASAAPRVIMERILEGHEIVRADNIQQAERSLRKSRFDMVVCTVLFDDSRMFDLLRLVKNEWTNVPFVCARARPHIIHVPVALEAVDVACQALGAAAFLNITDYNRRDPEDGMRKDIEKILNRRNQTNGGG
jgi:DNA-binding NtrC family response regulator